jgi:hypothetical protein
MLTAMSGGKAVIVLVEGSDGCGAGSDGCGAGVCCARQRLKIRAVAAKIMARVFII